MRLRVYLYKLELRVSWADRQLSRMCRVPGRCVRSTIHHLANNTLTGPTGADRQRKLMVMNMTNQVRKIAEVAKAVTSGDLTKTIEVDARCEFLDLNKTVNGMTESLSDFANEVARVVREVGMEGRLDRRANVTNVSGAWKVRPCPVSENVFRQK